MRFVSLLICCLSGLALSSLFADIIKGLTGADSLTISGFLKAVPKNVINELETNEQQAGQFICDIIDGNVPGIIENLGEDIVNEIKDDFEVITSFIVEIPKLAPEVLQDIVQDGEDVVSVVGEIFTNPKAVLTIIENGAEEIVSDIESVGSEVVSFFKCLFGKCSTGSAGNPAATLSASCMAIKSASITPYQQPVSSTSAYPAPQTSVYTTPIQPTTSSQSTQTSTSSTSKAVSKSSTSKASSTHTVLTTTSLSPAAQSNALSTLTAAASFIETSANSTQSTSVQSPGQGNNGPHANHTPSLLAWSGFLFYFVFVVVLL